MGFPGPGFLPHAQDLATSVVKDPSSFLIYLGTLEAEHKRLSEATETLTARNDELLGIIERANLNFVESRTEHDKEFTDILVKRIVQLNDENRDLKNGQEINKLLKLQNKMLQEEREYQTKAVLNQAENVDKEYTRLSGVLHEYGVNAARLRNERDILRHNLDVTRKAGEIEKSILRTEFNGKIAGLNRAYERLRAEVSTKISNLQQDDESHSHTVELVDTPEDIYSDDDHSVHHLQPSHSDHTDGCFDDLLDDDQSWQQRINLTILQDENKRLQNELNATHHVFLDLERSEALNRQLQEEVFALASRFSQVSTDVLNTFTAHFEKAIVTARNNFGKLQLTMDDQLHDNVDPDTASRIASFSERVCKFGQMPLSNMEQDIRDLVKITSEHFCDLQERLDTFGNMEGDCKDPQSPKDGESEKLEKDCPNPTLLQCLISPDQETLVDDSTDSDSSLIGPLLTSQNDTQSECCKSESLFTGELGKMDEHVTDPEHIHNEAAQAEMTWREEAFPTPQKSAVQVNCSVKDVLTTRPASDNLEGETALQQRVDVNIQGQWTRGWTATLPLRPKDCQ
ncbi:hypothetical protein BKA64DRAFT_641758 [Cadophora sp. MPI-SDFR-AT-0126]|nr:hypothetical protein BKA64DRAFT_641758 [Leotiomycetes sp. MPI-SDFR-AT-0126]